MASECAVDETTSAPAAARDSDAFQRLHASSLLFGVGRHARALLLPIAFVFFLARDSSWERWLAIFFLPSAAFEIYRYATTRYRLTATDLVLRRGLLFRSERNVPLDRVQNVDLVQNPLHRLLGVAEVRIETAAGSSPEAVLSVLTVEAAERLRGDVMAGRRADAAGTPEEEAFGRENSTGEPGAGPASAGRETGAAGSDRSPASRLVHAIPVGELVILGLVSNRGMALVLVAIGAAWELDFFGQVKVESIYEQAMAHPGFFSLPVIAGVALVALVGLRVLSVAWAILRFHGYELRTMGDDLRMRCGLFTRVTATVPRHRIQLVSLRQTSLQRWLGRLSVRIETAGGTGGGDADESRSVQGRRWFVPIVRESCLPEVLEAIAPGLATGLREAQWRPLSARARRRVLRLAIMVNGLVALVTGAVAWLVGFWWIAAAGMVLSAMGLLHAVREVRFMAFARTAGGVLFRSGAFTRQTSGTFDDKIQVVSLVQSPFDRRWDMATLRVDTAGAGPAEHAVHVPYLPAADARALLIELVQESDREAPDAPAAA